MIAKYISSLIFLINRWKIIGNIPSDIKKAILLTAPHTSNSDFFLGRLGLYKLNQKNVKFFIKQESFNFPFGGILKAMGGIPVNRAKNTLIPDTIKIFNESNELKLIITPEGTRKPVRKWKKGFHTIAIGANIPIILCYLDYNKKEIGIGPIFHPSENWENDLEIIKKFYADKTAKYPENFILPD